MLELLTISLAVLWCFGRRKEVRYLNYVIRTLSEAVTAHKNEVKRRDEIISKQEEFITQLITQQKLVFAGQKEIGEKAKEIHGLFANMTDHEVSGIVMFRKLEAARQLVAQHDPDSKLSLQLKELLS